MKVLRVLGLVFGILLLITGGGLLGVAALADRGQSAVRDGVAGQGLKGPVSATVVSAEPPNYTVRFTADDGRQYTAQAASTLSTPPEVGDTVQVYYQADDPSVAAITDLPTSALSTAATTLRTSGIVTLVIGAVLLIASIIGFVLARRKPAAVAPGQAYGQPYGGQPYPTQPYPGQSYPGQPNAGQPYPTQPYPSQPNPPQGYPGQAYPPSQGSGYPTPPPYPSPHRGQQQGPPPDQR